MPTERPTKEASERMGAPPVAVLRPSGGQANLRQAIHWSFSSNELNEALFEGRDSRGQKGEESKEPLSPPFSCSLDSGLFGLQKNHL